MTVKELADELGVSKPTISKAITDLGIEPRKVSNRFDISDADCNIIRTRILQTDDLQKSEIPQETPIEKTPKSQNETEKSLISLLETQISLLQGQLTAKDTQLAEKDRQLAELTSALRAAQEQTATLTAALTAAQALHAGTMQQQLIERAESVVDAPAEDTQERKGFWARLFGGKKKD